MAGRALFWLLVMPLKPFMEAVLEGVSHVEPLQYEQQQWGDGSCALENIFRTPYASRDRRVVGRCFFRVMCKNKHKLC